MKVKFKKLYSDSEIPTFGNNDPSNAGVDLYAHIGWDAIIIPPGEWVIIGTGVAWEPGAMDFIEPIDDYTARRVMMVGWKPAMIIKGRSGLAINQGIEATNAGVIDEGYRGEIKVRLHNGGAAPFVIKNGDRIAQGVIVALPVVDIVEAIELTPSSRGENGFGSTGR